MEIFDISLELAEFGLVVHEDLEKDKLYIARPAHIDGTDFRGWNSDDVTGISSTVLKVNAPPAVLTVTGKGKKRRYHLNISAGAAPGPGPEWFDNKYKTAKEVIEAVYGCYFSKLVDQDNQSLEAWFEKT